MFRLLVAWGYLGANVVAAQHISWSLSLALGRHATCMSIIYWVVLTH